MRTLFLQAPSFDGFDGGAGSRYQARREIASFWYPTWLAQPAALVENSQADRRAAAQDQARRGRGAGEGFRPRRAAHVHPLLRLRRQMHPGVERRQPLAQGRPYRRQGRGGRRWQPESRARGGFRRPQRIRLHHQGRRRRQGLEGHPRPLLPRRQRRHPAQRRPADPRRHGFAALRDADLQARSADREIFHRLSQAPLSVDLYRARLQVALHLLPVAADRRRPSLPHPQRRPCDRGDQMGAEDTSRR